MTIFLRIVEYAVRKRKWSSDLEVTALARICFLPRPRHEKIRIRLFRKWREKSWSLLHALNTDTHSSLVNWKYLHWAKPCSLVIYGDITASDKPVMRTHVPMMSQSVSLKMPVIVTRTKRQETNNTVWIRIYGVHNKPVSSIWELCMSMALLLHEAITDMVIRYYLLLRQSSSKGVAK